MRPFTIEHPKTIENALSSLQKSENAKLIAGGTTLLDLMKLDVEHPQHIIDITGLGLSNIEVGSEYIKIGALAKMSDVADNSFIKENYPCISESLWRAASPQLRNMATIAGNIMQRTRCSYFRDTHARCNKRIPGSGCDALEGENRGSAILGTSANCIATHPSDLCVALVAFDAKLEISSLSGSRNIALESFYHLPLDQPHKEHDIAKDEMITAIRIPLTPTGKASYYLKVRDRESYEFAITSAAVALEIKGSTVMNARVALGGVATKPWRAREVEKAIVGKEFTEENLQMAAKLAFQSAQTTSHNAFKVQLGINTIVEAFMKAMEGTH